MTNYNCYTTLDEIREHHPCEEGYTKLLKGLCKTKADDEPLHIITILDINGLDDALWYLCLPSLERLSRHVQAAYAERVLHIYEAKYPDDTSVRDQIAMLRNDNVTDAQRAAAWDAAWDAARDAAWDAAWDATLDAAGAAAWAAAWATAWDAAWDAAWEAARAAAWAATEAGDGAAAWDAAGDAERAEQERILREMCK